MQERFSFIFVFPEIVKTINFELCGITRAAEQNVLRLFQPRFQLLLLLSLPHRSSCTQPFTQLHPHTSAHFINKTWVSQALSQGADPSHSFREEVKQTCRRAKRADPSQNAIIMPIFGRVIRVSVRTGARQVFKSGLSECQDSGTSHTAVRNWVWEVSERLWRFASHSTHFFRCGFELQIVTTSGAPRQWCS